MQNHDLRRAIDACYEAFSVYPIPSALEASPLRDPAQILQSLTSAPLRELSDENIGPYAFYAMTTVGGVEDYKHFLPRILELALLSTGQPGLEAEIIALRLNYGEWRQWPVHEQRSVTAVFEESFDTVKQRHIDEVEADGWLCGMAILGLPVSDMLDKWVASSHPNSGLQIAQFIDRTAEFIREAGARRKAYWSHVDEMTIQLLRRWIGSASVAEKLMAVIDEVAIADRWIVEQAFDALVIQSQQTAH